MAVGATFARNGPLAAFAFVVVMAMVFFLLAA